MPANAFFRRLMTCSPLTFWLNRPKVKQKNEGVGASLKQLLRHAIYSLDFSLKDTNNYSYLEIFAQRNETSFNALLSACARPDGLLF